MDSQKNDFSTKRNYRPQNSDRPRNQTLVFNLMVSGVNSNGYEYDTNELYAMLDELNNNKTFEMLSVPVQIARSLAYSDTEMRGSLNIGYIRTIKVGDKKIDVSVIGKHVSMIEDLPVELCIIPRVLVRNGHVQTILGFDLVSSTPKDETVE